MAKYSDVDKGKSLMKDFKEEISERQEKNHEKVLLWSLREKRVSKKERSLMSNAVKGHKKVHFFWCFCL